MPGSTTDDSRLTVRLRAGDPCADPVAARLSLARVERGLFGRTENPSVEHYEILGTIAAGAMGTVLKARDLRLERTVAIKIMNTGSGLAHPAVTEALAREAKALARLAHPNVVAIHDTGELAPGHPLLGDSEDAAVYLVMEYVEGPTLAQWLAAEPRSIEAIVETFCAAGRGLAALHAAGLVHRDFKPSNVVVGTDGRVRVVDLGLSRFVAADEGAWSRTDPVPVAAGRSATVESRIEGTPAYMSPEQHRGAAPDARSDQFSFCAALLEALAGSRTFPQTTLEGLLEAKEASAGVGEKIRRLPRHVGLAIQRGLSPRPEHRFRSMQALVEALNADPRPRRRRMLAIGIGACAVAGIALMVPADASRREVEACSRSDAWLRGIWDPTTRAALEAAFLGTEVPYAASTWAAVEHELDDYVEALRSARTQRCEADLSASTSHHAAADGHAPPSQTCLDRRAEALRQLVRVLESVDATVLDHTPAAVQALPSLTTCEDEHDDPGEGAPTLVAELYGAVARARAEHAAGRFEAAETYARAAVERARGHAHVRAEARALLVLADTLTARGELAEASHRYADAVRLARKLGDHGLEIEGRVGEGHVRLSQARHDEARKIVEELYTVLMRQSVSPALRAEVYFLEGRVMDTLGEDRLAETAFERSLAAAAEAPMEDRRLRARTLIALGAVKEAQADYDAAERYHRDALALWERIAGPEHPRTADALTGLSLVAYRRGDLEGAREGLLRAFELRNAAYGEEHLLVASTLNNLGSLSQAAGDHEQARKDHERALALRERILGRDHPKVAQSANNLGTLLLDLGDVDGALAQHTAALRIRERAFGSMHPSLGSSLFNLGAVYERKGDLERAESYYRDALKMWAVTLSPEHPFTAEALHALGRIAHARGREDEARDRWREAERILAHAAVQPRLLDEIREHLDKTAP